MLWAMPYCVVSKYHLSYMMCYIGNYIHCPYTLYALLDAILDELLNNILYVNAYDIFTYYVLSYILYHFLYYVFACYIACYFLDEIMAYLDSASNRV